MARSLLGLALWPGLMLPAAGFENMNGEYVITKTPNAGAAKCELPPPLPPSSNQVARTAAVTPPPRDRRRAGRAHPPNRTARLRSFTSSSYAARSGMIELSACRSMGQPLAYSDTRPRRFRPPAHYRPLQLKRAARKRATLRSENGWIAAAARSAKASWSRVTAATVTRAGTRSARFVWFDAVK